MAMENKICDLPGIKDGFFMSVPDMEHDGYKKAWFYLVPEEGAKLEDIEAEMKKALEPYEYPSKIKIIEDRPYFHFKTGRRVLIHDAIAELEAEYK